ncbi:MAG: tetratricopeptide repeat protein [Planctomycetota bacterium]
MPGRPANLTLAQSLRKSQGSVAGDLTLGVIASSIASYLEKNVDWSAALTASATSAAAIAGAPTAPALLLGAASLSSVLGVRGVLKNRKQAQTLQAQLKHEADHLRETKTDTAYIATVLGRIEDGTSPITLDGPSVTAIAQAVRAAFENQLDTVDGSLEQAFRETLADLYADQQELLERLRFDQYVLEEIRETVEGNTAMLEAIAEDYLQRLRAAEGQNQALRDEHEVKDKLIAGLERRLHEAEAAGRSTEEALAELRAGDPRGLISFLDDQIDRRTADLVELHTERYAAAIAEVDYPTALTSARVIVSLKPSDGDAYNRLGLIHHTQGDYVEALAAFREAERIDRAAFSDEHPKTAIRMNNIGSILKAQGDYAKALTAYREAERIDRAAFGDNHSKIAVRMNNIGNVMHAQGDYAKALAAYREAERIDRATFGDEHPKIAVRMNNIGNVMHAQGDYAKALAAYRKAERIDRAAFGDEHPNVAIRMSNIGNVLEAQGNYAKALTTYRKAEQIFRVVFGDEHPNLAVGVNNIGGILETQGDYVGALAKYREAFGILIRKLGPNSREAITVGSNLRQLGGNPVKDARAIVGNQAAKLLAERLNADP